MLLSVDRREAEAALAGAINAAGGLRRLSPSALDFLAVTAAALPGTPVPADAPPSRTDPAQLSAPVRRQMVRTAIVLTLLSEQPSLADHARLADAARALDVAEPAVDVVAAIASGSVTPTMVRTVEFDAYRTPLPRDLALFPAYARFLAMGLPVAAIHGTVAEPRLAALFADLAELAVGTAGRTFADFYAARDWQMPGNPGAVALPLTLHDWLHIYIDVTTEPLGEVEVGAFAAGVTRHQYGFHNLLLGLLMFEYGMTAAMSGGPGLSPTGAGLPRTLDRDGARAISGNPIGGRMVADALLRGYASNTDLYLGVDHLAEAPRALHALRAGYGVPSRGHYAAVLAPL
jgi:hypothetical protein